MHIHYNDLHGQTIYLKLLLQINASLYLYDQNQYQHGTYLMIYVNTLL